MDAADARRSVRFLAGALSPRRWRWHRFLASLPLDPDRLPRPVPAPGPDDFIICGPARSGTALLTAMVFQPPEVVTVMEPWDGMRLDPAALFASLRHELDTTGRLTRGRLDVDALVQEGITAWVGEQQAGHEVATTPGYALGVKWPGYWRYLDLLPQTRFLVCLRDPAEVVASCKAAGGRVGAGLQYPTAFNRQMNRDLAATSRDPARRRVALYDYVMERVIPHLGRPNVMAVRYERWFEDPDALLAEIGDFLGRSLLEPLATIRPRDAAPPVSARDRRMVREHCRTAAALGYAVTGGGGGG